jgi:hypothetical protein
MFWRGFLTGIGSVFAVLVWAQRVPAPPPQPMLSLHPQNPPAPNVTVQAEQLYAELERTHQWTVHHSAKPSTK